MLDVPIAVTCRRAWRSGTWLSSAKDSRARRSFPLRLAVDRALTTGELYNDLGGDYFRKCDPERTTKCLIAQLEALGHTV